MFPITRTGQNKHSHQTAAPILVGNGGDRFVPNEVPIAFVINRTNYAVMLATPDNMVDYAVGFLRGEDVIQSMSQIENLDIVTSALGLDLRVQINADRFDRFSLKNRRRNIEGRAGCGLCGLENADHFRSPLPKVAETVLSLDPKMISTAMNTLFDHQPLFAKTRAVHAAAWIGLSGQIQMVREDVGRHNALDKLLGAKMQAFDHTKTEVHQGFVLMSSRCSYELIEKLALSGVRAIACLSAPTKFALSRAASANIAVYGKMGGEIIKY